MPGWLVATEGQLTLALDIEVTPALRKEGTARELVNRIQKIRKDSGLEVTDRVDVVLGADGEDYSEIAEALEDYRAYVASQTLSVDISLEKGGNRGAEVEWNDGIIRILVTRK